MSVRDDRNVVLEIGRTCTALALDFLVLLLLAVIGFH